MGLDKPLNDVTKEDLYELIETGRSEDRTLEYKAQIDSDTTDFLADITSFANTEGGYLLLGVEENGSAEPVRLCGVNERNVDKYKQKIHNLIRDCVDPSLPDVNIHPVSIGDDEHVVVIWIPSSLLGPHMVTKGKGWFFRRHSTGKESLDVAALRNAFLRSATFAERARNWRSERVKPLFDPLSVQIQDDGPVVVLHVVPLRSFEAGVYIDVKAIPNIVPLGGPVHDSRYNFDGLLTVHGPDYSTSQVRWYAQFYRDGCVESAYVSHLYGNSYIPLKGIESMIISGTRKYIENLVNLSVPPPAAVMISLLGVEGCRAEQPRVSPQAPIDRPQLPIPEVIIERFDQWKDYWLRPAFDTIWNAAGYQACPYFTEEGTWNPDGQRT